MVRRLIGMMALAALVTAALAGPAAAQRVDGQRVDGKRTESSISAAGQAKVAALARGFMRARGVKGMSIGIGANGKLLLATGFGEARPGLPSGKDTVYPIGDITQQLTAAALLWWQDRNYQNAGPVRVNDPVNEYFFGVAHWQGMKLGHLLTHTSGLPPLADSVFFEERLYSSIKAHRILDFVKGRELDSRPGEKFRASRSNYFLITQVIEVGLRLFFHDYIQTEIYDLNGMTRSGFLGTTPLSRRAQGYADGRPSREVNPTMFLGSADATSTVVDLIKFDRELMRGRLFSAEAKQAMFSRHIRAGEKDLWHGAGWYVRGAGARQAYFTLGRLPGFSSINKIYRSTAAGTDRYVVILTNADGITGLEGLADRLLAAAR
ncbi:MAG: serine hydrolase [Rhodospirillaceae bacterium]|nr:serine hydrolase [Rhodospirillaceae bacterium]MDE0617796.1 serine hydrolase [Rhodospirillaceae bacterium]